MFHRDRFRFVLRHLELTTDPDRPELFRKGILIRIFLSRFLRVTELQRFYNRITFNSGH